MHGHHSISHRQAAAVMAIWHFVQFTLEAIGALFVFVVLVPLGMEIIRDAVAELIREGF
jgi:hypothetical protein